MARRPLCQSLPQRPGCGRGPAPLISASTQCPGQSARQRARVNQKPLMRNRLRRLPLSKFARCYRFATSDTLIDALRLSVVNLIQFGLNGGTRSTELIAVGARYSKVDIIRP